MSSEHGSTKDAARRDSTNRADPSWVSAVLTLVCPSIGFMSVGRLAAGLVANALVVSVLTALLVSTAYWGVFPGIALLFGGLAWLSLTGMMALEVASESSANSPPTRPESGFHWTSQLAVALLTLALPLGGLIGFAGGNLYSVVSVNTNAMYPSLNPGDRVIVTSPLVDSENPRRGQLAAFRIESRGTRIVRVVATPGSTFSMAGRRISVDQNDVPATPVRPAFVERRVAGPVNSDRFDFMLEGHDGARYLVSFADVGKAELLVPAIRLRDGQWYGLADNRSQFESSPGDASIIDSRQLGPFGSDQYVGQPTFFAWATNPSDGSIDWGRTWARLGQRLQ